MVVIFSMMIISSFQNHTTKFKMHLLSYLSYYSLPLAKAMKVSKNSLFNYR